MMKSAITVLSIIASLAVVYIGIRIMLIVIIVYADNIKRKGLRR